MRNREKGGTTVNSDQGERSVEELCRDGLVNEALEKYIVNCYNRVLVEKEDCTLSDLTSASPLSSKVKKKQNIQRPSFPNLAGFCRYLGIATEELEDISQDYPTEYKRILTALEDEALNSSLSPTLLSAYLKKRLGYDKDTSRSPHEGQLEIRFEHDILEDGQ